MACIRCTFLLSCICCWTGINVLIYVAGTVVQWIVIGEDSTDGIDCQGNNSVALVGAIFSTLATLFKIIAAFCSCCCQGNNIKLKLGSILLLQLLQLFFKFVASILTAIVIANRFKDLCHKYDPTPDTGTDTKVPDLIAAGSFLEFFGFILAITLQVCNMCHLHQQRKRAKLDQQRQEDAGEYAPLLNNGDGKQK